MYKYIQLKPQIVVKYLGLGILIPIGVDMPLNKIKKVTAVYWFTSKYLDDQC